MRVKRERSRGAEGAHVVRLVHDALALLPGVVHVRERVGDGHRVAEELGAAMLDDEQVHLGLEERRCGSSGCAARAAHVSQASALGGLRWEGVPLFVALPLRFFVESPASTRACKVCSRQGSPHVCPPQPPQACLSASPTVVRGKLCEENTRVYQGR